MNKNGTQYGVKGGMHSLVSTHTHPQYLAANIHQWQHQMSGPVVSQLPLQTIPHANPIWSQGCQRYPYLNPQFGHHFQSSSHSIHSNTCCLANQPMNCSQMEHNCNQISVQSSYHCIHSQDLTQNRANKMIESGNDMNGNTSKARHNTEENSLKNEMNGSENEELKQMNENLRTTLDKTKQLLRETQKSNIKMCERLANDYIEKYRVSLKKFGDYIREECNRFYQNETIAKKLEPIVEQITQASIKVKEEKERFRETIAANESLLEEENLNSDVMPFDYNCLPDFPDLLSFYKSILDEIPLIFLADLSQFKKFANYYIQSKKQSETNSSVFSEYNGLNSNTNPIFSAPNIVELPKPDFSLFGLNENQFRFRFNSENTDSHPSNGNSLIQTSFNNESQDLNNLMGPALNAETQISPIGQPLHKNAVKKLFDEMKSVNTSLEVKTHPNMPSISESHQKQSLKNESLNSDSVGKLETEMKLSKLSQAQIKLLAKLREKYDHLSDQVLVDSITQTKSLLIANGFHKGFSGMKVCDIIDRISQFIDNNIIDKSAKFRIPKTMLALKVNSKNNIVGQMASQKGWTNTFEQKQETNNDNICSICFEAISVNNKYETECHHFFHTLCISNWMKSDCSCPICRSLVLSPGEFPHL